MAFSDADKERICNALNIDTIDLQAQLIYAAPYINAATETVVLSLVTQWEAFNAQRHIRIQGVEKNFGANVTFDAQLQPLEERIAKRLHFKDNVISSGDRMQRG